MDALHILLFAHFQSGQICILDPLARRSVKKKKWQAWEWVCVFGIAPNWQNLDCVIKMHFCFKNQRNPRTSTLIQWKEVIITLDYHWFSSTFFSRVRFVRLTENVLLKFIFMSLAWNRAVRCSSCFLSLYMSRSCSHVLRRVTFGNWQIFCMKEMTVFSWPNIDAWVVSLAAESTREFLLVSANREGWFVDELGLIHNNRLNIFSINECPTKV